MGYKLIILPRTEHRLSVIYEWGVQDSGVRAARAFLTKIESEIKKLIKAPTIGPLEILLENRKFQYRSFVVHQYFKVIYYIIEENNTIYIVDIWDTRMDPEDLQSHINKL